MLLVVAKAANQFRTEPLGTSWIHAFLASRAGHRTEPLQFFSAESESEPEHFKKKMQ